MQAFPQPVSIEDWDEAARVNPHIVRPFMMAAGDTRDGATLMADMESDMERLRVSNLNSTPQGIELLERLAALSGQRMAPLLAMVQGRMQGGATPAAPPEFAGSLPHGVAAVAARHESVSTGRGSAWANGGAGHGPGISGNAGDSVTVGAAAGGGVSAGGGGSGSQGVAAGVGGGSSSMVGQQIGGAAILSTGHATLGEVGSRAAGSRSPAAGHAEFFGCRTLWQTVTAPGTGHGGHEASGLAASVPGAEADDAMQIVAAHRTQQAARAAAQAASFLREGDLDNIPVECAGGGGGDVHRPSCTVGTDNKVSLHMDMENFFSHPSFLQEDF